MISTAIAIQNATKEAVYDESVMEMARMLFNTKDVVSEESFAEAIFQYSAHLSAMTATLVTHAILTKSQLDDMLNTIREMEQMGKDVE